MKTFRQFLAENKIPDLDMEFLARAERVTSLNLSAADFTKIDGRKKEIRYLFTKHFFPTLKEEDFLKDSTVTKDKLNSFVEKLKNISAEKFNNLYSYNLKGVGPGEVLLYYAYDLCKLGGGSSAGLDVIFMPSGGYEIKAAMLKGSGYLSDFKLGGTFSLNKVENALFALAEKEGFEKAEISTSKIDVLKKKYPKEFGALEADYADIAYNNYFKNHEIIFFDNAPSLKRRGSVLAVKQVQKSDIKIERYTSKSLKPLIKL
jgi:hypothetical protein